MGVVLVLPPSGKTYEVEMLMGGVSSFLEKIFDSINSPLILKVMVCMKCFSFTLSSKMGKLYLNTAAQLKHYHDASGDLISINMAEWWYVMGVCLAH
jgi:hypothetical protein